MAFSQANLVGQPSVTGDGRHLRVSWVSTDPAGTLFQVYLDRVLSWRGTDRVALFPYPRDTVEVQVGAVGAGEGATDFSGSLPAGHPCKARLDWVSSNAAHEVFRVYSSSAPGGAVDYSTLLASVPSTLGGVDYSGWGYGGWGQGFWGEASSAYSWESGRLASGVWTFAVVPVDDAGQAGTPQTVTCTISGPPRPPAPDASGKRLAYSFNSSTLVPTLSWLAAP